MNYIGSKIKLLPFIEETILKVVDKKCRVFCDLFAGTGVVGSRFKEKGFKVISNDIQYYSYVLNKQLIGNHQEFKFDDLNKQIPRLLKCNDEDKKDIVCEYLTNIKGKKKFIYYNYSPSKKSNRMYFTSENAMKCDASRSMIEQWYQNKNINQNEYFFLIASLISSMDKYANVLSVYGAYLKSFKKIAQQKLIIKAHKLIINDQSHEVYNVDANKLIKELKADILYLDPPYNSRQYGSNYHVLETIAKYDEPEIYGKTGLRDYKQQKSLYCLKNSAMKSLENLVKDANVKYIFLSYNNEGIISQEDIEKIFTSKGTYSRFEQKYSRYKSDSKRKYKTNFTIEYLHCCKCN